MQGLDYVYTVNGWLKSINSTEHERTFDRFDPGNDQKSTSKYVHDQFGMQLGYHENDYYSDSGYEYMNSAGSNHLFSEPSSNLYNGNISNWEISYHKQVLSATGDAVKQRFGNTYRYDVLGRLTSNTFYEADQNSSSYTTGFTRPTYSDYSTIMNYDPNGNFTSLERRGPENSAGTEAAMDFIEYYYETGNNRLNYANDGVGKSFTTDLGMQAPDNYDYTELGELETDRSESSTITWTPDGKVRKIELGSGNLSQIEFYYDARGDRVAKIGRSSSTNSPVDSYTIYHRDAAGNVLAIYDNTQNEVKEGEWICVELNYECALPSDQTVTVCIEPGKWYEDGNKIVIEDFYVDHPDPQSSCNDGFYSSLTFNKTDNSYLGSDPNPTDIFSIESWNIETRTGGQAEEQINLAEWHLYGSSAQGRVATVKPDGINYANTLEESASFGYLSREVSDKFYEIKDHLGNIRLVFSDLKKVEADPTRKPYKLDLTAVNNYYPFGMLMPENNWNSGLSRYGFNGHENDNEVKGTGNHIAFGDYGYDTRLGRRWNQDPIARSYQSNYVVFRNNPVYFSDPTGLFETDPNDQETGIGPGTEDGEVREYQGGKIRWNGAKWRIVARNSGDPLADPYKSMNSPLMNFGLGVGDWLNEELKSAQDWYNKPGQEAQEAYDQTKAVVEYVADDPVGAGEQIYSGVMENLVDFYDADLDQKMAMLGQVTPALAMMAIPGPGGKVRRVAGLLPQLSESLISKMMKSAKLPHKNGLTKVGHGFEKHSKGSRSNSPFPAAIGNPDAKNIQGATILNQILRSENKLVEITPGGQIKVFDLNTGRGVLFDQDGEIFKGFRDLELESK